MSGLRTLTPVAAVLIVGVFAATSANAAISSLFTDLTTWQNALPGGAGVQVEDFESFSAGPFPDGGGLVLNTPGFSITQDSGAVCCGTPEILDPLDPPGTKGIELEVQRSGIAGSPQFVRLDFNMPIIAFGAFFNSATDAQQDANTAGSILMDVDGQQTAAIAAPDDLFHFRGIISDTPFTSLQLLNAQEGNANSSREERFQMDNIHTAKAAAIPEPATLSLLGAGLAGIGFVAWRRRKKAS